MHSNHKLRSLFLIAIALSTVAWAQGGRGRGAAAATPAAQPAAAAVPQAAAPQGGRGGATAASDEFYNYSTSATSMAPIPDGPPVETHQKITADGQMLAYTTHAGFLALRNATTGQSEAHVFFTSYSKDGVTDASSRPLFLFFGGAPGVAAAWQEFGGLGPKKVKLDGEAAVDNPSAPATAVPISPAKVPVSGTAPPTSPRSAISSAPTWAATDAGPPLYLSVEKTRLRRALPVSPLILRSTTSPSAASRC
jgi:hypothetical protein